MIRLALRVDRAHAELALAELLELAPGGVEEVDHGDAVEYAVYGPPGELPDLPDLEAAVGGVGGALVSVTTTELPDDWSERWKDFHKPLVLDGPDGPKLAVRPPWEAPIGAATELVIDPAQAFGTGSHATTRLCLELLLAVAEGSERGTVVDVGCGSGVLAIAAAQLGFEPVIAVDYDPLSVDATRENAAVNGVTLDVRRGDLRSEPMPTAPTVLANLLRPLLLDYAESAGADSVAGFGWRRTRHPNRHCLRSACPRGGRGRCRIRAAHGPARDRPARAGRVGGAAAQRALSQSRKPPASTSSASAA